MSIEIRNFYPVNGDGTTFPSRNITFNIAALDGYTIDITSLSVVIETNSLVDSEQHTITYTDTSSEVSYAGKSTTNYSVTVNPSTPFEGGLSVTVAVNISGTTDLSASYDMTEYTSSFTTVYDGVFTDFKNVFVYQAENIPIYNEILHRDSTTSPLVFDSAFGKWKKSPTPKIQINQVLTASTNTINGYSIDYDTGKVIFNSALDYNDQVDAAYKFSFFTDEQIDGYLERATDIYRVSPPVGGPVSIHAATQTYKGIIMVGAAQFAFMDLMMSLAFQEQRLIFDNHSWGNGWINVKELFRSSLDLYKEMWKQLLEAKKADLPSIAINVSSAMTLPGGRTVMSRNLCNINGGQFVDFETIYNMMYDKIHVNILSKNKNGKFGYFPISCIEHEGKKDVWGCGLSHGKGTNLKKFTIRTSEDHKYETPAGMVRLKNLKKGDKVISKLEDKIAESNIEEIGYDGFLDCYEIQVPHTEKFFCEDIKISNSRMFRYMYK